MSAQSSREGRNRKLSILKQSKRPKSMRRIRGRWITAVLLLITILWVFHYDLDDLSLYLRKRNSPAGNEVLTVQVPFDLSGNAAYSASRDLVILATQTKWVGFRSDGSQKLDVRVNLANPALASRGRYTLLYDRGGTQALLSDGRTVLTQVEAGNTILTGAVCMQGGFALVTKSKDVLQSVEVYTRTGRLRYRWDSASTYITAVSMSENGLQLAVGGFTVSEAELSSVVRIVDVRNEQAKTEMLVQDELVMDVYFGDTYVYAITDRALHRFDLRRSERTAIEFGDEQLRYFALNEHGATMVLGDRLLSGSSAVVSYSADGQIAMSVKVDGDVRALSANGERVVLLQNRNVNVYLDSGELHEAYSLPSVLGVVTLQQGQAACICTDSISFLPK